MKVFADPDSPANQFLLVSTAAARALCLCVCVGSLCTQVISVAPTAGLETGRRKPAKLFAWLGTFTRDNVDLANYVRVLEPPLLWGDPAAAEELQVSRCSRVCWFCAATHTLYLRNYPGCMRQHRGQALVAVARAGPSALRRG
jgi:hypothetical protein